MAARWKITSGRSATSFSANPGTAKSPATVLTEKPALAGFAGSTTSCSVIRVMSVLPRRPSRSRRSVSLRPTMPAAPRMRMCKGEVPSCYYLSLVIPGRASWGASPESITTIGVYGFGACAPRGASRNDGGLLLHRSGHRRHVVLDKERVEDDQRQRTGQRAGHQRAPAIDVAVDELVDDRDRHGLVAGRLQE